MDGICPTCGKSFTSRVKKMFCSQACYLKSPNFRTALENSVQSRGGKLGYREERVCQNCGLTYYRKPSDSRTKFCSQKCYTSSSQIKEHLDSVRDEAATALGHSLPGTRVTIMCLFCGNEFQVPPGEARRKRRFCGNACFRRYFADRFDRWVASPESIPLPQNYDEFLAKEELPCLVEGCEWVGKHLGMHVSHAHGITADEFKEIAGFNRGTGLCTLEVSKAISEKSSMQNNERLFAAAPDLSEALPKERRGKYSRRQEQKEHQSKMIALNAAEKRSAGLDYRGKPLDELQEPDGTEVEKQ